MSVAKQLTIAITIGQVQLGLMPYVSPTEMSLDYLMSDAFKQCVEWFSETRGMSVLEIIAEFKRMNGISR